MASKTIGILTGGGDCPGLNAVIRAVTKSAIINYGYEVLGFEDGFLGLVEDRAVPLGYERTSGILAQGGTILGTNNRVNPFAFWREGKEGKGTVTDETDAVRRAFEKYGLDVLVCVGGDGTMTIAHECLRRGFPVVGIPKTIDNDLEGTDQTFGFDTAVSIITEALDRIHTTAMSHHRAMVVEVMGRNAGWLALSAGLAGGADILLIPEIPYDIDVVCERVRARSQKGKRFSIVVAAEGARPAGGEVCVDRVVEGSAEPVRLGGIGKHVADEIEDRIGIESRVTVLGHLQRGGSPSARDRILGTLFGKAAVDLIAKGRIGEMVCLRNERIESVPLERVAGRQRTVPLDHPLIAAVRAVGAIMGDKE